MSIEKNLTRCFNVLSTAGTQAVQSAREWGEEIANDVKRDAHEIAHEVSRYGNNRLISAGFGALKATLLTAAVTTAHPAILIAGGAAIGFFGGPAVAGRLKALFASNANAQADAAPQAEETAAVQAAPAEKKPTGPA